MFRDRNESLCDIEQLGIMAKSLERRSAEIEQSDCTAWFWTDSHQLSLLYNVLPVVPQCGDCHALQKPTVERVM
jgi:hypothetical protein